MKGNNATFSSDPLLCVSLLFCVMKIPSQQTQVLRETESESNFFLGK